MIEASHPPIPLAPGAVDSQPTEPPSLKLDQMPPVVANEGDLTPGGGIRDLPEPLWQALLKLKKEFEAGCDIARREYVRKCIKHHEFFRSNQWGWWDYQSGTWRTWAAGSGGKQSTVGSTQVQSLYVLNIFQGFTLAIISLIAGNKLNVKWWPDDGAKPEDVSAAKKNDLVMRAFRRWQRVYEQMVKKIYHLCMDGTFGSYVRTVVDGDRFGYLDEIQMENQQVPFGPGTYNCVICQTKMIDRGNGFCINPNCRAPLSPEPNVAAPMITMPIPVGVKRVPRGRTLEAIVGGLELKLPPTAAEQSDFPFLMRSRELQKGVVRATFPEVANKIGGSSVDPGENAATSFERRARVQAAMGTSVDNRPMPLRYEDFITFTECWFRKTAFYELDNEKDRADLLQMFPNGCYVAFANDVFCEARQESMDDHWRICHALPGRGQIREPIMGSVVPLQELCNDLVNIIRDVIEFTLPATFIDNQVLDVRKWARSSVMAGAAYNVTSKGNRAVGDAFFQTQPGQLPQYATTFLTDLRTNIAQFASGAFPASYGSASPGNDTAAGIQREQQAALGRINLYLQALTEHASQVAEIVVKDFKNNAIEPISFIEAMPGGDFKTHVLTPEDLEFGEAHTIAEVDDSYPTTWPDRQAQLMTFLTSQTPIFQGMLSLLSNADRIKRTLGTELDMAGEKAYALQFKIIQELLQAQPIPGPMQPIMDPNTGQPVVDPQTGQPQMQPGPPMPSIEPNSLEQTDNASMIQACVDYYFSEEGQNQAKLNGPGWQNFMLHAQARQAMAQGAQPPPGVPPPGAGPAQPPQPQPGQAPPPEQAGGEAPAEPPVM